MILICSFWRPQYTGNTPWPWFWPSFRPLKFYQYYVRLHDNCSRIFFSSWKSFMWKCTYRTINAETVLSFIINVVLCFLDSYLQTEWIQYYMEIDSVAIMACFLLQHAKVSLLKRVPPWLKCIWIVFFMYHELFQYLHVFYSIFVCYNTPQIFCHSLQNF